jgi:hypothetical protein
MIATNSIVVLLQLQEFRKLQQIVSQLQESREFYTSYEVFFFELDFDLRILFFFCLQANQIK